MIHSLPVFIGVTLLFMGGCAFMTGQAVANTWRPLWHALFYCLPLGAADRFLAFALFDAPLLSWAAFLLDTALVAAVAAGSWQATRARRMCLQYPWLYERAGLFGWRERVSHHP